MLDVSKDWAEHQSSGVRDPCFLPPAEYFSVFFALLHHMLVTSEFLSVPFSLVVSNCPASRSVDCLMLLFPHCVTNCQASSLSSFLFSFLETILFCIWVYGGATQIWLSNVFSALPDLKSFPAAQPSTCNSCRGSHYFQAGNGYRKCHILCRS